MSIPSVGGSGKTLRLRQLFDVSAKPAEDKATLQWHESDGAWKPGVLTAADVGAITADDVYGKDDVYTKDEADAAFLPADFSIAVATESTDGLMSAADKVILDGLADGGASVSLGSLSAHSSSDALIGGAFSDVSGCSLTLNKTGVWLIIGHFGFIFNSSGYQGSSTGRLMYNGAQSGDTVEAAFDLGSSTGSTVDWRLPATMMWFVSATSGQVAKLQVKTTYSAAKIAGGETSIAAFCLTS